MNTDDMTREELIEHYEHRIACERQSHADRLSAAEKAFALWRERLEIHPEIRSRLSQVHVDQINDVLLRVSAGIYANHEVRGLVAECRAAADDLFRPPGKGTAKASAKTLAANGLELLFRLTEDA